MEQFRGSPSRRGKAMQHLLVLVLGDDAQLEAGIREALDA
jgi:hypothetical protein